MICSANAMRSDAIWRYRAVRMLGCMCSSAVCTKQQKNATVVRLQTYMYSIHMCAIESKYLVIYNIYFIGISTP